MSLALVTRFNMTEMFSQEDFSIVKNPGKENMEIITKEGKKINKYTPSEDQSSGKQNKGRKVSGTYTFFFECLTDRYNFIFLLNVLD